MTKEELIEMLIEQWIRYGIISVSSEIQQTSEAHLPFPETN